MICNTTFQLVECYCDACGKNLIQMTKEYAGKLEIAVSYCANCLNDLNEEMSELEDTVSDLEDRLYELEQENGQLRKQLDEKLESTKIVKDEK